MLKKKYQGVFYGLCMMLLWAGISWGETPREAQFTLLANPVGVLYSVGAEFGYGEKGSFVGRLAGFSWDYDEDGYSEEGSGTLVGLAGRYYTTDLMKGMYFGAGIDFVSASCDWYDYPLYGTTEVSGVAPNVTLGYKALYDNVVLEPNIFFSFLPGDIEADMIIGLGVALGYRLP